MEVRRFTPLRAVLLSLGITAAGSAASAAATRPVLPEDLYRLALVSGVDIAPDGGHVALAVTRLDGRSNSYRSNLWLVATAGGSPHALTNDGASSAPAWSPDGKTLAFVRGVRGVPQIFALSLATRRVTRLTKLPYGASGPVWSHDGKRIAYAAYTVDPAPPAQIDFAAAGFTPTAAERTSDIRAIDTERYEVNGLGFVYDKHAHIRTMTPAGAQSRQVTFGPWSERSYAWSADDRSIAFVSFHHASAQVGHDDVYIVRASGGTPVRLKSPHASNEQPVFARRSKRVFFFSGDVTDTAGYPALTASAPDGSRRTDIVAANTVQWGDWVLADLGMPGSICGPLAAPDDRSIVTNYSGPGTTTLVKIDTESGARHDLTAPGEATQCSASANGRYIAYAFADFTHPAEVRVLDTRTGSVRAVTAFNASYLARVTLSKPQPFRVTDAKGYAVQAWFMPAVGPLARGRRPTLLDVHGGPQAEFGAAFFHELQYWAGHGYNVVFSNPEGSIGYGHAFEEALVGSWGPPMFDDVTRVMDAVSARSDVDASRLGVIGGSYGGYATLWIVSHTDRFRAAISERPASDLATQQLDWFDASSNGLGGEYAWGKPWDSSSASYTDSPLNYVEHVHTPVMLLHSDEDTETPLDQTLDEFSALKELGRTARFIDVPHENHDLNRVGQPLHRVERLHIFTAWFDRYFARSAR